jgi:hypothetical protein
MKATQTILSVLSALLVAFMLILWLWGENPFSASLAGSAPLQTVLAVAAFVCVLATTVVTLIRNKAV